MISLEYKFLFIHVPKTGGNSIQNVLNAYSEDTLTTTRKDQDGVEQFGLRNDTYNLKKHSKLSRYRKCLDAGLYQQLFKFATIRNPWDKMISLYFSPNRGAEGWDREKFKRLIRKADTLHNHITLPSLWDRLARKTGLQPRSKALDRDIDTLIRFENLNDDFIRVCRKIGLPDVPALPARNRSDRKPYACYYDEELKDMVEKKFMIEIEYGDYEFSNNP